MGDFVGELGRRPGCCAVGETKVAGPPPAFLMTGVNKRSTAAKREVNKR